MNDFSWDTFEKVPLVGILRGFSQRECTEIGNRCEAAGLTNLEVTMNSPGAAQSIAAMRDAAGNRMNIGAGTVCTLGELEEALAAGAQFIITPAVVPEVITECHARSIPIFPGALTPTEILTAWNLGADIVKVFPARAFGPSYFRDLKGPLPQIKLMPTGGVGLDTLSAFFDAGAFAASIGGQLFDTKRLSESGYDRLEAEVREYVMLCSRVRSSRIPG